MKDRLRHLRHLIEELSILQRQTLARIFASLMAMGLISAASHFTLDEGYRSKGLVFLLAVLPAAPMLAILLFLGRYLAGESDEFIRMMVIKSLLWGAAVTVVGDMTQSVLVAL